MWNSAETLKLCPLTFVSVLHTAEGKIHFPFKIVMVFSLGRGPWGVSSNVGLAEYVQHYLANGDREYHLTLLDLFVLCKYSLCTDTAGFSCLDVCTDGHFRSYRIVGLTPSCCSRRAQIPGRSHVESASHVLGSSATEAVSVFCFHSEALKLEGKCAC